MNPKPRVAWNGDNHLRRGLQMGEIELGVRNGSAFEDRGGAVRP